MDSPLILDTSFLRTAFFVPGETPYIFSKLNPPNTDTRYEQILNLANEDTSLSTVS